MLIINSRMAIPLAEFKFEFARSSGPGGQNVNKVNSKAVLRWRPCENLSLPPAVRTRLLAAIGSKLTVDGEWLVSSQRTRDQRRNIEDCFDKVRDAVLAVATAPKVRRPTKPTLGSQLRRVDAKSKHSATKKLRRSPTED